MCAVASAWAPAVAVVSSADTASSCTAQASIEPLGNADVVRDDANVCEEGYKLGHDGDNDPELVRHASDGSIRHEKLSDLHHATVPVVYPQTRAGKVNPVCPQRQSRKWGNDDPSELRMLSLFIGGLPKYLKDTPSSRDFTAEELLEALRIIGPNWPSEAEASDSLCAWCTQGDACKWSAENVALWVYLRVRELFESGIIDEVRVVCGKKFSSAFVTFDKHEMVPDAVKKLGNFKNPDGKTVKVNKTTVARWLDSTRMSKARRNAITLSELRPSGGANNGQVPAASGGQGATDAHHKRTRRGGKGRRKSDQAAQVHDMHIKGDQLTGASGESPRQGS
eukprot:TRINITY_DN17264_c0_g1_i3.p2 TRINITY_DN17264_c0_g1~~TRINITY_DN17264_c0_g1_i3.p2  ORF type:complete len:337 (+),score=88.19 TRINITY_DN17264_c0_g1_i3:91-1101(+)